MLLIDVDNFDIKVSIELDIFLLSFMLHILSIFLLIALILFCVNFDILTDKFCFITCKFDTTTASKKDIQIMRNGIMGCSEDKLKDALNTNDLSDFDSFFVQKLSNLQAAIKDMHQDDYYIAMIQNNKIYLNKERTEYLDFDIMFMLLNPDELIDCYEQEMELEKDKKPLVGDEYNYSNSKQRVESWLDKNKSFLPQIERRSVSQHTNIATDKPRTTSANNLKLPSIVSAQNDKKKNLFPKPTINNKFLVVEGTKKPLHLKEKTAKKINFGI